MKQIEPYLIVKRNELMWALAKQGYTSSQIGRIFGLSKARANTIIKQMPTGWTTPWKKLA